MEEISNQKPENKKEKSSLAIQDYLSLGYIYLLILGVFHETIYYNFLEINILEYSSVLDVLISPISVITGNLFLGTAIIFAVVIAYLYKIFLPRYYKFLGKKQKYQYGKKKIKLEKAIAGIQSSTFTIFMIGLMIFSVFIGMGIGRGTKTKGKINAEEIKLTHQLFFEDGTVQNIRMLGKNTLYVFYVTKSKEKVSIAPIDSNIKIIKKIED